MVSINSRLDALETVVANRWGEYAKPDNADIDRVSASTNDNELLAVLIETLKGMDEKMSKLSEAMDNLVRETAEMGSAIEAHLAQSAATVSMLRENAQDPEAVLQIANALEAYQQRLASAAVVNTPATQPEAVEAPPITEPVTAPLTPAEAATTEAEAVKVAETPEAI